MHLPKRIFFTGVPGSRWSGIAQILENRLGLNTTDRTPEREYSHGQFTGHKGVYFGPGMEFPAKFAYIDIPFNGNTPRLIKSHDWAFKLDEIKEHYPEDRIIIVYRDEEESFNWWKEAGGFDIDYPSYQAYKNDDNMKTQIALQNESIRDFCRYYDIELKQFGCQWLAETFGIHCEDLDFSKYSDIKIAYV